MNNKTYELLRFLIQNRNHSFTLKELADKFNCTDRTIRNYISSVYDFLKQIDLENAITKESEKVSFVGSNVEANKILTNAAANGFYEYKLSSKERQFVISLILLLSDEYITLSDLEEELFSSKVTISNDIKKITEAFAKKNIYFTENKHKGFMLDITESQRRENIYFLIKEIDISSKELIENSVHNICVWFFNNKLNINIYSKKIEAALSIVEQHYKINMADEDFYDLILVISIALSRFDNNKTIEDSFEFNENDNCIKASKKILDLIYNNINYRNKAVTGEVKYLSKQLFLKHIIKGNEKFVDESVDFHILVRSFLYKLSNSFLLDLSGDYKLQEFLTAHIITMANRIKNKERLINPYKDELIKKYNKEYLILNENKYILEEAIGENINEDETTYILMHIIASIERLRSAKGIPKVLVSCHAGFGTSHFLAENIKNQFRVEIIDVTSSHFIKSQIYNNPEEFKKKCDFIISTTPIVASPVPWIRVNPLMTVEDKERLHKMIMEVSAYLPQRENQNNVSDKKNISETLSNASEYKNNKSKEILFSRILDEDCILLDKKAVDWKDAIVMAGEPLLWKEKITAQYLRAMVNAVLDNGPYFVFVPGVALAHANPVFGAKELAASFLRLREPVKFNHKDNDPVIFVIALSVLEAKKNLDMLFTMMNILRSEKIKEELSVAKDAKEVINIFEKYQQDPRFKRKHY